MGNDIHDTYHFVTKGVAEEFGKREREIKFNPDLSPEGRDKRLAKNEADRRKEIDKLRESYKLAYDKEIAIQDKKLNGKQVDYADKARDTLKGELIKAVNLGELDKRYVSLDDNARVATLLDAMTNNHKELVEIPRLQALGHRSESWHRKEMAKAIENKDIEYLTELHKSTNYMHDGDIADKLKSEYEPAIKQVQLELLTPEQREALDAKGRLEHSRSLLEAEFESVAERGQYMGYRNANKEQPVNTLTYVGSDRVLGKSPIQRQFSQYKNNK